MAKPIEPRDGEYYAARLVREEHRARLLRCPCHALIWTAGGRFHAHRDRCVAYRAEELRQAQALAWRAVIMARRVMDTGARDFELFVRKLLEKTRE